MTAIDIAESIARVFEGYRAKPYLCPAQVATIGYGTTRYPNGQKVSLSDPPVTVDQATAYMHYEMQRCIDSVVRYCPVLVASQASLGAIADFVFNLGAGRLQYSTLRRRINQRDWPEVRHELMRWTRGGGRILPGLVARRKIEASYFKQP